ncbi:ubiquinone biosynthesis protein [Paenalcaligenes hominis]|uniref:Ubiquinone biosynthesis protein n=1 Tax=Paenalcaligenes hominis TaxID=643674 RepID=A0ABX0WSI9_9BURK|nr:AarF/UbiB family protein [Paenalcaligenes hominis]NJB65720.1 ubiquinone biosynthesis protein [Paenalcaligenes hominis]GGE63545.1 putative protein kinase UbiB [Paenalcaligenes hominis]
MLETALVAARDRARLAEVAGILISFGLDGLVAQLGLHTLLPNPKQVERAHKNKSVPERLRHAIEALGPTYVKLGQILATRHDLLGPEWTSELEKLHNHVAPVPWDDIEPQLIEDLGANPYDVFAEFCPEPIAAASIAQIYKATLKTGQEVVLKVRRPQLRPKIEADLRLLRHLASLLEQASPDWARFKPESMVTYLASAMRDELDFVREAHNCEQLAAGFEANPYIVFPRIYWPWTSERLLVQDFIPGVNATRRDALAQANIDPKVIAQRGTLAVLQMIFQDGVFHADPHPGNLLALSGNQVGFIDFGLVGHVSARRKIQLLAIFQALLDGRSDRVTGMLLAWSAQYDADPNHIDMAVERFLAQHSVGRLRISQALMDFMALARQQKITLPADLSLLFKALMTADGVLTQVDPQLDVVRLAEPMVREQIQAYYSINAVQERAKHVTAELYELSDEIPNTIRLLLHRLRHGRVGVDMELRQLDRLVQIFELSAIRLCMALVTAAFVLGLAPRLFEYGPVIAGIPLFAWFGLAATAAGCGLLAFWLFKPK